MREHVIVMAWSLSLNGNTMTVRNPEQFDVSCWEEIISRKVKRVVFQEGHAASVRLVLFLINNLPAKQLCRVEAAWSDINDFPDYQDRYRVTIVNKSNEVLVKAGKEKFVWGTIIYNWLLHNKLKINLSISPSWIRFRGSCY